MEKQGMLSRRGIFGLFAGAAVAAPAITEALANPRYAAGGVVKQSGPLPLHGAISHACRWSIALDEDGKVIGLVDVESNATTLMVNADGLMFDGSIRADRLNADQIDHLTIGGA